MQKTKKCNLCNTVFPATGDFFHKASNGKYGLNYCCKNCAKKRAKEWSEKNKDKKKQLDRNYAEKNKDKISKYQKEYREKNKEAAAIYSKEYRYKNREILKEKKKEYFSREDVKKRKNEYCKKRRLNDTGFKLTCYMRSAISESISKHKGALRYVDWRVDDLILHIEKQFLSGMNWENYGKLWHIDHIIPICEFDYKSPEDIEFKQCWSLSNLRPLWASENCSKSGKVVFLI